MIVHTTRFGDIEINKKKIIELPEGILGFSDCKRFYIMDYKDTPFKWFQSLENPGLAFVIINPLMFEPNYHININKKEVNLLNIDDEKDVLVSHSKLL